MAEHMIDTDVLVVGGGMAGSMAAIKAREQGLDVTQVDKAYAGKSGASISPPAGMTVFNPEWGVPLDEIMHAFDVEGEYINNREWDEAILKDSLSIHQDLADWGVKFPPYTAESVKMISPPYTNVPIPFRGISPVLRKQGKKVGVKIMDRIMATDLLKQEGRIAGVIGFSIDTGDFYVFRAKATVLAGGGNSFKPAGMPISALTGDADAMGYRAGVEVAGKEFCSTTHPTRANTPAALFAWKHVGPPPFIGWTDAHGDRVEMNGEPGLELEFLIHAGKGPIIADFDNMSEEMKEKAAFLPHATGKVPLAGGAGTGYIPGGMWVVDTKCTTSLPGLYPAGDCCGTSALGAFSSNVGGGTCPACVTGRRAGAGAAEYALQAENPTMDKEELARLKSLVYAPMKRKGGFSPRWVTQLLQNTMIPYYVLFIKNEDRLQAALTMVEFLRDHHVPKIYARDPHELRLAHETRNMVLNAEMMLRASLFRTESRGYHYREDYPRRDDSSWLAWTQVKEEQGRMTVLKVPVPKEWCPDLSKPYEERYPKRFPGESET